MKTMYELETLGELKAHTGERWTQLWEAFGDIADSTTIEELRERWTPEVAIEVARRDGLGPCTGAVAWIDRVLGTAVLRGADLSGETLDFVDLSRVDLRGADLSCADLSGSSLVGADLRGARLDLADLREAALCGADLRGASLEMAELDDADMSCADMRDAVIGDTDLSGADLTAAIR